MVGLWDPIHQNKELVGSIYVFLFSMDSPSHQPFLVVSMSLPVVADSAAAKHHWASSREKGHAEA